MKKYNYHFLIRQYYSDEDYNAIQLVVVASTFGEAGRKIRKMFGVFVFRMAEYQFRDTI